MSPLGCGVEGFPDAERVPLAAEAPFSVGAYYENQLARGVYISQNSTHKVEGLWNHPVLFPPLECTH